MTTKQITCIDSAHGENWTMYRGDCVEVVAQMPSCSVDFSVYSPPFADLFIYSESERDMGNNPNDDSFAEHYGYLLREMFRVTRPGRINAVHVSDLPARKSKEGFIGMRDFSGEVIRAHIAAGFHFHGRFTIWKDPVREMQRTKSHGLLYKNIKEDSTRNRMGFPDYVLLFKRPPTNKAEHEMVVPVTHTPATFPLDDWQMIASPIWNTNETDNDRKLAALDHCWRDIDQSNTLNARKARGANDERHMCPLQLDVIDRLGLMYSNPGDVCLSPFGGIGSEGIGALRRGLRYVGVELKDSYFATAVRNLKDEEGSDQMTMFGAR